MVGLGPSYGRLLGAARFGPGGRPHIACHSVGAAAGVQPAPT